MFPDTWRDIISIAGLLITTTGFAYTIYQVWLVKSVANAAQEAAEKALAEIRRQFHRYVAANAHRFVNEAKIHIEQKEWAKVALRLNDVADQVAQLTSLDPAWGPFVNEVRRWSTTYSRLAIEELKRPPKGKWSEFIVELQARIDACHGPFTTGN